MHAVPWLRALGRLFCTPDPAPRPAMCAALPPFFTRPPVLMCRRPLPQVEQLTRLQHAAEVWQVEWNLLGSWLAASTDAGDVCLWRPDLGGEWLLLNRVVGEQQAAA